MYYDVLYSRISKNTSKEMEGVYWAVADYRMMATPASPGELTSQVARGGAVHNDVLTNEPYVSPY